MNPQRFAGQLAAIFDLAVQLAESAKAEAIMILLESPTDWEKLKARSDSAKVLIAADRPEQIEGAAQAGFKTFVLHMEDVPVFEKLTQALLESVAQELLKTGSDVIAVYSGFEPGKIDSLSYIRLDEHLGRLTVRDLRQLKTRVPLETLKAVVDIAVEIGREGREGKPVGTMFVVGDARKVMENSHPAVHDPFRGYSRKERNVRDRKVRESIKELAQLDGAFVIEADGVVASACRILDSAPVALTLSKGLGARHWAAAGISKNTKAIAVVVSESSGTVRLFQNGEVVLRIEPFRRAMKWKEFDYEPPTAE
ncbi:MAG: diadenylate cyclase [Planctomycetes bacterium]|nr:diadenylate cyclase [Planctomycetota bacterium]